MLSAWMSFQCTAMGENHKKKIIDDKIDEWNLFFSGLVVNWSEKRKQRKSFSESKAFFILESFLAKENERWKQNKYQSIKEKMSKWKNFDPVFHHHWFLFVYKHKASLISCSSFPLFFFFSRAFVGCRLGRRLAFGGNSHLAHKRKSFLPTFTFNVCFLLLCNELTRMRRCWRRKSGSLTMMISWEDFRFKFPCWSQKALKDFLLFEKKLISF